MTNIQARRVIHQYAKQCSGYLSQGEWDSILNLPHNIPAEVVKARETVPKAWKHFGYWVWQPIRRDR